MSGGYAKAEEFPRDIRGVRIRGSTADNQTPVAFLQSMYGTRRDWESQKSDQKVRRLLEDSIPGDRAGLSPEIQGMNVSIVHNEGMFLLLRANETVQLRKRRNNVAASLSARQLAVFSCSLHTTDQHLTGQCPG